MTKLRFQKRCSLFTTTNYPSIGIALSSRKPYENEVNIIFISSTCFHILAKAGEKPFRNLSHIEWGHELEFELYVKDIMGMLRIWFVFVLALVKGGGDKSCICSPTLSWLILVMYFFSLWENGIANFYKTCLVCYTIFFPSVH